LLAQRYDESNFDETFIAVGRVFCGVLRTGAKIHVIASDGTATGMKERKKDLLLLPLLQLQSLTTPQ
jgi:hypothetical protein